MIKCHVYNCTGSVVLFIQKVSVAKTIINHTNITIQNKFVSQKFYQSSTQFGFVFVISQDVSKNVLLPCQLFLTLKKNVFTSVDQNLDHHLAHLYHQCLPWHHCQG